MDNTISKTKKLKRAVIYVSAMAICILILSTLFVQAFGNWVLFPLFTFAIVPIGIPILMYVGWRERFWLAPVFVVISALICAIVFEPFVLNSLYLVFISSHSDGSTSRFAHTILTLPFWTSIATIVICWVVDRIILGNDYVPI